MLCRGRNGLHGLQMCRQIRTFRAPLHLAPANFSPQAHLPRAVHELRPMAGLSERLEGRRETEAPVRLLQRLLQVPQRGVLSSVSSVVPTPTWESAGVPGGAQLLALVAPPPLLLPPAQETAVASCYCLWLSLQPPLGVLAFPRL